MRKIYLIPLLMVFLIGCAGMQQKKVDLAVNVNQKYQTLRQEYLDTYENSDEDVQSYMDEEVAPQLNDAREKIIRYNSMVLRGTGDREEKREVIIEILVGLERKLEVL